MPPKFLLKFHAAVIKEIPITKTPVTIGRKPDNDIVIDNMSVSGHHARVVTQGTSYVLEDLQSTNGTFLNDKRILNSAIRHEDSILIGQHSLVFVNHEEQAAAAGQQKPMDSEATIVMTPSANQPAEPPQPTTTNSVQGDQPPPQPAPSASGDKLGTLRVIEGKADQPEYELTALLTYFGKSETAAIKIKGMFAPDIAALISKRPTGYLLTAVKDGYPKLNGNALSGQTELKDGDLIEVGGIKFLFKLD